MRPDPTFEHAHFRMVSTTTEQARGFNAEVSNTLLVVVHDTEAVLLQGALILFLYFLKRIRQKTVISQLLSVNYSVKMYSNTICQRISSK